LYTVDDIRELLAHHYKQQNFVTDKSGVKTIELLGTSFIADVDHIFGEANMDYVERELEWYKSQSLQVSDIPGKTPAIWEQVADKDGSINSNYGFLIWSYLNYNQYANVFEELKKNPNSRRAVMIYNRPSMHYDYCRDGMSDFICTNAVNYTIRDGRLNAVVQMRSNDAIFGYRNDYHWQKYVLDKLADELGVESGDLIWNAASLHIYERHFYLVDHYFHTGKTSITKTEYETLYGK